MNHQQQSLPKETPQKRQLPLTTRTPKTPRTPVQPALGRRRTRSNTGTPQAVLPDPPVRTPKAALPSVTRRASKMSNDQLQTPIAKGNATTTTGDTPSSRLRRSPRLAMPKVVDIPDEESHSLLQFSASVLSSTEKSKPKGKAKAKTKAKTTPKTKAKAKTTPKTKAKKPKQKQVFEETDNDDDEEEEREVQEENETTKTPIRKNQKSASYRKLSMTPVSKLRKRRAELTLMKKEALKRAKKVQSELNKSNANSDSEPDNNDEVEDDDEIEELEEHIDDQVIDQSVANLKKKQDQLIKARLGTGKLDSIRSNKTVKPRHRIVDFKTPRQRKSPGKSKLISYKRLISNKARLMTIDVINQIMLDYFSTASLPLFTSRFLEANGIEPTSRAEIHVSKKLHLFMANYKTQLSAYFDSLIDTHLTNNLITQDLQNSLRERNVNREAIFEIRQQRFEVLAKVNSKRRRYLKLKKEFSRKLEVYKKLLALKRARNGNEGSEGDGEESKASGSCKELDDVLTRLSGLNVVTDPNHGLIDKLKSVNSQLHNLAESVDDVDPTGK
ncbi:unnamed protein product [Ambrosiozyma monospora]|uniref:Unnamed protein product n=1 Tax=Ambrosiozyma monospora TaxID=43982 RepID=A0ACB5TAF3_AMBMO|nr:unnamed protein product [Ambrosiozyma monospora]